MVETFLTSLTAGGGVSHDLSRTLLGKFLPSSPRYHFLVQHINCKKKCRCYGIVRYGMVCQVWYGVEWYGMAWHGMEWYGMVWYGMVWYGMVWHGMV